jgi:D-glycero-D-manno-heptose 1,7-bisphosphate phosphatase
MLKNSGFESILTSINKKVWIFDRDGVINKKAIEPNRYILRTEELNLNLNVIKFIADLQRINLTVAVATNQQCVGKKLITYNELSKIHHKIDQSVNEAGGKNLFYYICTHLETDKCDCRKPNPGLLNSIQKDFSVKSKECIFIGDSESDKKAASLSQIQFLYFKEFQKLISDLV